ncbi:hypothetical protein HPB51_020805 [Rhipicephalus microplus]|uniref:Uncharacterized protein n=1 Tax=Rhipicephalus microplus TaxID=6941 RepID=A0A9J6DPD4_RHIMP|nr:hypothetical protein HPB51_020805 [Rhipicephalus microplus]
MRSRFQGCQERNLNPKTACLKRREEEKSDEGAKLGAHGLAHPGQALDALAHQRLGSLPGSARPVRQHKFFVIEGGISSSFH